MDEKKWKEKVRKSKIKGTHYLLSKNQRAFFERYFNLKGFPHHQIIDKAGKIYKDNFPQVIPQNFESILEKLEKIQKGH